MKETIRKPEISGGKGRPEEADDGTIMHGSLLSSWARESRTLTIRLAVGKPPFNVPLAPVAIPPQNHSASGGNVGTVITPCNTRPVAILKQPNNLARHAFPLPDR